MRGELDVPCHRLRAQSLKGTDPLLPSGSPELTVNIINFAVYFCHIIYMDFLFYMSIHLSHLLLQIHNVGSA
jgi:hypothetical protein